MYIAWDFTEESFVPLVGCTFLDLLSLRLLLSVHCLSSSNLLLDLGLFQLILVVVQNPQIRSRQGKPFRRHSSQLGLWP